eukprot:gene10726-11908_t
MQIVGTLFVGNRQYGDFHWMITSCGDEYNDSLFLFNDNEEHHFTARRGRGNAVIREFNRYGKHKAKPRSSGIPTGTMACGGYMILTPEVQRIIDGAFVEIKQLLATGNYKRVFYSMENKSGRLGTALFQVGDDVLDYITHCIHALAELN